MIFVTSTGKDPAREELLATLVHTALEHGAPSQVRAFLWMCLGLMELYRGRFIEAENGFTRSLEAYGGDHVARWERNYARVNRAIVLDHLGRYDELDDVVAGLDEELSRSADRLSGAFLDLGAGCAIDLRNGHEDRARRRLARDVPRHNGVRLPPLAWMHAVASARVDLYNHRPAAARQRLERARRDHRTLFAFQHIRAMYCWLLAGAAAQELDVRRLRECIKALRKDERILSPGVVMLVQAHLARADRRMDLAKRRAADAAEALEHSGWRGYAAAARHFAGGSDGSMRDLGVAEPERWIRLFGG